MKPEEFFPLFTYWVCAVIIGLIGLVLVILIATGKIDLRYLLVDRNDPEHKASLAKLQFLIFTFVIALSLFALTIKQKDFPKIDPNIMVLLGISAGSSVAATGIAASERTCLAELKADVLKVNPNSPVRDL